MNENIKTAITSLAGKAETAGESTDALKFSQAALNLANIAQIQHYIKQDKFFHKNNPYGSSESKPVENAED